MHYTQHRCDTHVYPKYPDAYPMNTPTRRSRMRSGHFGASPYRPRARNGRIYFSCEGAATRHGCPISSFAPCPSPCPTRPISLLRLSLLRLLDSRYLGHSLWTEYYVRVKPSEVQNLRTEIGCALWWGVRKLRCVAAPLTVPHDHIIIVILIII